MESKTVKTQKSNPIETLGEVIQWICSPRGGNNFYGRVLNGCGRTAKEGVGTAAVTLTNEGKYMFYWDPTWFCDQTMALRVLVVIHEAAHIVLQHCERGLHIFTQLREPRVQANLKPFMNIAMDMAVNDVALRAFIEMAAFKNYKTPLIFPENPPFEFPIGLTFEQYLDLLIKKSKKDGFNPYTDIVVVGEGQGQGKKLPQWVSDVMGDMLPKHLPWMDDLKDMTDAEIEQLAERATRESKNIIKKALEQTEKNRGTIPGNLQNLLDEMLKEHTVPWEVILQGMLKTAISSKLQESVAWPNVGMLAMNTMDEGLEPYPGFQKDFEFHIAMAVDTSGSVSDEEFQKFMSEIQGIQRTNKAVTVQLVMFDAAIQHEMLLAEDDPISRHDYRYGYGGTSFTPPLKHFLHLDDKDDWAEEAERIAQRVPNPDLVVMLTDGYAPVSEADGGPMPKYQPQCPILWVLTPTGQEHESMGGRLVRIREE